MSLRLKKGNNVKYCMSRVVALGMLTGCLLLTGCSKEVDKQESENIKEQDSVSDVYLEDIAKTEDNWYIIEKKDLSLVEKSELTFLDELDYVENIQLFGTSNRINCYCQKDKDYKIDEMGILEFIGKDRQMRSAAYLSEDDLVSGRLPEVKDEIVLYSEDEGLVGEKIVVYLFDNQYLKFDYQNIDKYGISYDMNFGHMWGLDFDDEYYIQKEFTIVGILKSENSNIYFKDEYCDMISKAFMGVVYSKNHMITFDGTEKKACLQDIPGTLSLDGNVNIKTDDESTRNVFSGLEWTSQIDHSLILDNKKCYEVIFICDDSCKSNEVRLSKNYIDNNRSFDEEVDFDNVENVSTYKALYLNLYLYEENNSRESIWIEDSLCMLGKSFVERGKINTKELIMSVDEKLHNSGALVLLVGKELFNQLYHENKSYEVGVCLNEETDLEELKKDLENNGYRLVEEKKIYDKYNKISDEWSMKIGDIYINNENYKEVLNLITEEQ